MQARNPQWQRAFLARPVAERQAFAAQARAESQRYTRSAGEAITDVNAGEVRSALHAHGVRRMIHGHTHRPAIHAIELDDAPAERAVLGDWYEQGSVLQWTQESRSLSQRALVR
jgi:UDP-2,3-diacylglucosamine hydrolase